MRWPWRRRKPAEPDKAQRYIDRLERQQPEVDRLSRELHAARQRNHFAELIAAALRGAS
jgi:hypothetical protein